MDSSNLDRLSELPDALILEILSLLPMNDVVGTMVLSKRWLHLWTTIPCLEFKARDKYEEFVSCALSLWKGSNIRKFSFSFYLDLASMADSWLIFAIEKEVEELRVLFDDVRLANYCPPQRLYSCSSVTKMLLSSCDLRIDGAVQWNRLKSLVIGGEYSLREDAMNRILAGAPLLEELSLQYIYSTESFSIRSISLKVLKLFILDHDYILLKQVVRIWAPNLLDLEISGYIYGTFLLDVPSLTKAWIDFDEPRCPVETFHQVFRSIRHVEDLTISTFDIKILLSLKRKIEFSNVKSLSFYTACAEEMLRVLHMFPNLSTLRVRQDKKFPESKEIGSQYLSKADLPSPLLPYLKQVEITWFVGDESINPAVEILLENAKLLDKMVFRANWYYWEGGDNKKPEVLLSKSASSPTAEEAFFSLEEELEEADEVIDSHLSKADLPSPFLPFLKRVEITWYKRDVSIIPALEILLENAKSLDKMVVTANWAYWFGDKPELLLSKSASSPTAEVTIILCFANVTMLLTFASLNFFHYL